MNLICTALLCEAQPIIENFKLIKIKSNIYKNKNTIVAISGIGKKNITNCLHEVFESFDIKKAINIGIAGCSDKSIKIGQLYCTNADIKGIEQATITTVSKPTNDIQTMLVDMEASAFIEYCTKHNIEHFVFKVVSDYLDSTIPKKSFVTSLIKESLNQWIKIL